MKSCIYGVMVLNKDMKAEGTNIIFEIGKYYKHDENKLIFSSYKSIDKIPLSIDLSEKILVETMFSSDYPKLFTSMNDGLGFISCEIKIIKLIESKEIIKYLQNRLISVAQRVTVLFSSKDIEFSHMIPRDNNGNLVEVMMNVRQMYDRGFFDNNK